MAEIYDTIGREYTRWRRPDPRIVTQIREALGDARTVLNVGAGSGSYEPNDRFVVAVEPSSVMLAQRPPGAAPAVRAVAEALPFPYRSFDACTALLTHHHWSDWSAGMRELMRVARRRVVVFTHDVFSPSLTDFWLLRDYFSAVAERIGHGFPALEELRALLGGRVEVVPVPADCTDGFLAAYWRRPERYLDERARGAISYFHGLPSEALEDGLRQLADDVESGEWRRRNAPLLERDSVDYGYRLVIAEV